MTDFEMHLLDELAQAIGVDSLATCPLDAESGYHWEFDGRCYIPSIAGAYLHIELADKLAKFIRWPFSCELADPRLIEQVREYFLNNAKMGQMIRAYADLLHKIETE